MKNFSQQFEMIYEKYCSLAAANGVHGRNINKLEMARFLGVSQGKMQAWQRGQWPHAEDLATIAERLGFPYRWLVTGEGDPEGADAPTPGAAPVREAKAPPAPPVPMVGLASCGVQGLEQIMPFAVAVSPIVFGPRMIAVVASGESMVPAGIASGHVCYCDPDQAPMVGEAVFLRRRDGLGALKLYLGEGEREGSHVFKGWLSPNGGGLRQEFVMDVEGDMVESIAPVIFVRRRL